MRPYALVATREGPPRTPWTLHAHLGGANETVITWIDNNGRINIRVYNDIGTQNNALANVNAGNVNTAAAPISGALLHAIFTKRLYFRADFLQLGSKFFR